MTRRAINFRSATRPLGFDVAIPKNWTRWRTFSRPIRYWASGLQMGSPGCGAGHPVQSYRRGGRSRSPSARIAAASTQRHAPFNLLDRIAAAIALLAFGAAMGWFAALKETPGTSGTELASAALRGYATFAVEVAHPVEVHASDEPHLETGLSRRIGQPIIPPDLSKTTGFTCWVAALCRTSTAPPRC